MGEFILILVISAPGWFSTPTSTTAVLFPSQKACERAKDLADSTFGGFWSFTTASAVCVPRNAP